MPKKLDNEPTLKQKLFAQEYVRRKGNITQSALAVYDVKSYRNAKVQGMQNMKKPAVKLEIQRLLNKAGLGIDKVLDTAKDAMLAGVGVKATNADTISMIDKLLHLYNAYPDKRSMNLNYSRKEIIASKDFLQVQQQLQKLQTITNKLIQDLEYKK